MGRKYFAGFLLGDTYYFHGGIDSNGKVMGQFVQMDMHTMLWTDVRLTRAADKETLPKYDHISTEGLLDHCYGHKMCVVTYNRAFVELDALGEVDFGQVHHSIKYEGVYMFGGVFGRSAGE